MTVKVHKGRALILRSCDANRQSRNGFQWPESGPVEAPDWKPTDKCGNGLHGFLWGEGDGSLARHTPDAVWLVAEIDEWVELGGKVKFPRANVLFAGPMSAAADYIRQRGATGAVIGATVTAGDDGTANAGDDGTANAGDRGTANAGDDGTANAGNYGTANAGDRGTANAGKGGTIIIKWFDGDRYRLAVGYVGEDGIKPNTPYRVVNGKFSEVRS